MWERLSRRLAWDTHFWLSKACSASWDQHPAGRGAGAPRGEEGPPEPEQAPRWWGLHPGGQQGALHTGEQGEDAGSLQDVTPRPAPAQSRAALHGAPQQQGDAEPRSHTGRCGESCLWGARSQARPRLERGSGGCSGLHPLARAGPWAPRVTSILAPLSFPPPPPLSTLIQHPQSHWGSAAFERIHVS